VPLRSKVLAALAALLVAGGLAGCGGEDVERVRGEAERLRGDVERRVRETRE